MKKAHNTARELKRERNLTKDAKTVKNLRSGYSGKNL